MNLVSDGNILYDDEGVELPDLETACFRSIRIARGLISEEAKLGRIPLGWSIEIMDESGEIVSVMAFENTVTLH